MGSVISFPFLCLLNAAVCRMALELDMGSFGHKLRKLPFLVNGDDCILMGSINLMKLWETIIQCVGLSSSIGKTYFSKRIIVMNSMLFIDYEKNGSWEKIPHVNMGLMHLQNKSGPCAELDSQLSGVHEKLLEFSGPLLRRRVHDEFVRTHYERIALANVPPFMPLWAGGLGLYKPDMSEREKSNPNGAIYNDLRALSTRISKNEKFSSPPKGTEWLHHMLAMKTLRDSGMEPIVAECFYDEIQGYGILDQPKKVGEAYSYLIYSALLNDFDCIRNKINPKKYLAFEKVWWIKQRNSWNAALRGGFGSLKDYESLFIRPNKPNFAVVLK